MQESFLHYIWQFQHFDKKALKTVDGQPIKIFTPGTPNNDAGPDFSNGRIHIGAIEWVGNVEIHTRASGWYDHGHDNNPAYDNVILHVVWQYDKPVWRNSGDPVPTLELQDRIDSILIDRYRELVGTPLLIPCEKKLPHVKELIKLSMLDKTAMHRLKSKSADIMKLLKTNNNDWEETTYQLIAQNFGFKVNREPFLQLARSIPLKVLLKHGDSLTQIEALLFGQAGFLNLSSDDDYVKLLQREYETLSVKYNLKAYKLDKWIWKFLRLRPANFPTLRIAQLSALIFQARSLFSQFIEITTSDNLISLFEVKPSHYWHSHYHFEKKTKRVHSQMGRHSLENLIINTVSPLLISYGQFQDRQDLIDRAVHFLQQIPAEKNNITRKWIRIGFTVSSALASQGLIELNNNFCLKRKCLSCAIGVATLKSKL